MLGLGAGIDYSLLIIGRYREQVAARRQRPRRVGEGGRDLRRLGRRRRPDRDGRDRRPARDRHPAHRQARHRRRDRRRRRRRVGADDPADHDRARSPSWLRPKKPEHVRPSPRFERWGELVTARPWLSIAAGVLVLLVFAAPVTQLRLGQPDDGNQPTSRPSASPTTSSARRSAPAPTARSCSRSTSRRATPDNEAAARRRSQTAVGRDAGHRQPSRPRRPARTARWRRSSRSRRPRRRTRSTSDLLERLRDDVIPEATAGHAAEGLRRRQHGRLRGLLRQGRLAPAAVHRASSSASRCCC